MAGYNLTRSVEDLLEKTESLPPSFTIHLHPEHWTLNSGSKFLYNNQVASLLDDIRAHRIPVDFLELFDSAKVPFYDGCMVVELLDYRSQKSKESVLEKPERTRVVLHPNPETLWADICLFNQRTGNKWTDNDAVEIEARILMATAPPLCLDPDPHLTRIANNVLRVSTPTVPVSLKRKAAALDLEEDETDKARRAKIMQFMNPRANRPFTRSYRILDTLQRMKAMKEGRPPSTAPQSTSQPQPPTPVPQSAPTPTPLSAGTPPDSEDATKRQKQTKKTDTSKPPYTMSERVSSTPTPAPPAINQFLAQHQNGTPQPAPSPAAQSPMQAHVLSAVNSTDPSKSHPSPSRQQFSQSPRVPPSQPARMATPSQPPQQPAAAFPQPIPSTQYTAQSASNQRNMQPKAGNNVPNSQPMSQPNTPAMLAAVQGDSQVQAQQMYAQRIQNQIHTFQQQEAARRLNATQSQSQTASQPQVQNGRSTPQGPPLSRSPMNANLNQAQAQATAQRSSPLARTQPLTTRSPMPPTAQQQQQPHQMPHAAPQHSNYGQYNPALLRAMLPNNGSPHPQVLPPHMNGAPSQGTPSQLQDAQQQQQPQPQQPQQQQQQQQHQQQQQQQAQMQMMAQYSSMYNYAQMYGRLPPGYPWPMNVSRQNVMNGQHPMAANGAHPQQVPLGVGKTVPGQLQGR